MNQTSLNRAVARATGEPVERIHRMGFSLVMMPRLGARFIGNHAIRPVSMSPSQQSTDGNRPTAA